MVVATATDVHPCIAMGNGRWTPESREGHSDGAVNKSRALSLSPSFCLSSSPLATSGTPLPLARMRFSLSLSLRVRLSLSLSLFLPSFGERSA